jgi:hypothetical protein
MSSVFNSKSQLHNLDNEDFLGRWEDIQAYTSVINTIESNSASGTIRFQWVNMDDDSVPSDDELPLCEDSYTFVGDATALTKQFDTRARWFRLKIEGTGSIAQFATTYKKSATEIKLTDNSTNIVSVNVGEDNENSLFTVLTDMSGNLLGTTNDAHAGGEALFTHLADVSGHSLSTTDTYRSLTRKLAPTTGWRPDDLSATNIHNGDGNDGLTTTLSYGNLPVAYLRADFSGGEPYRYSENLAEFRFTTVSGKDMSMSIAVANGVNGLSGVTPETRSTRDTRVTIRDSNNNTGLLVGEGHYFTVSLGSSAPDSKDATVKIANEAGSTPSDLSSGYLTAFSPPNVISTNLANTEKVGVAKFSGRQEFTVKTLIENDILRDGLETSSDPSINTNEVVVLQSSYSEFTTDYTLFNYAQMRPHVGKSVILANDTTYVDNLIVKELEIDTSIHATNLLNSVDFSLHSGTYIAIGSSCGLTQVNTGIHLHFEERKVFDVCGITHGTPTSDICLTSLDTAGRNFLKNIFGTSPAVPGGPLDFSFAKIYGLGQYYLEPQERATNKYYNSTIGNWTNVKYNFNSSTTDSSMFVEFNDSTVGVQSVGVGTGGVLNNNETEYFSMQSTFALSNRQVETDASDTALHVIEDQNTFILPKSEIPFKHGDIIRMALTNANSTDKTRHETLLDNLAMADNSGYLKVTGRAHFIKEDSDNIHFKIMVNEDISKWFTEDSDLSGPSYRDNEDSQTPNGTILSHASDTQGVSLELADFFKPIPTAMTQYRFDDVTLYDTSYRILDMTVSFGGTGFVQGNRYNGYKDDVETFDVSFYVDLSGRNGSIVDVSTYDIITDNNAVFSIGDVIDVSSQRTDGSNAQLIVSKVRGPDTEDFPSMDKYHSIIGRYWGAPHNNNSTLTPPTSDQGYPLDLRFYKPAFNESDWVIQFDISTTNNPSESLAVGLRDGNNNTFSSTGAGFDGGVPPTVYYPLSVSGGRASSRKILYLLETNYNANQTDNNEKTYYAFSDLTVSINDRIGVDSSCETAVLAFNGGTTIPLLLDGIVTSVIKAPDTTSPWTTQVNDGIDWTANSYDGTSDFYPILEGLWKGDGTLGLDTSAFRDFSPDTIVVFATNDLSLGPNSRVTHFDANFEQYYSNIERYIVSPEHGTVNPKTNPNLLHFTGDADHIISFVGDPRDLTANSDFTESFESVRDDLLDRLGGVKHVGHNSLMVHPSNLNGYSQAGTRQLANPQFEGVAMYYALADTCGTDIGTTKTDTSTHNLNGLYVSLVTKSDPNGDPIKPSAVDEDRPLHIAMNNDFLPGRMFDMTVSGPPVFVKSPHSDDNLDNCFGNLRHLGIANETATTVWLKVYDMSIGWYVENSGATEPGDVSAHTLQNKLIYNLAVPGLEYRDLDFLQGVTFKEGLCLAATTNYKYDRFDYPPGKQHIFVNGTYKNLSVAP